jgi:hypothetical protein
MSTPPVVSAEVQAVALELSSTARSAVAAVQPPNVVLTYS